mgnify:CR=1 FL=1
MGTGYDSWVTQDWWEYTPQNFSVEDNTSEIEISVYPNPASEMLAVGCPMTEDGCLEIYNAMGEKVFSSVISHQSSVNVKVFAKGIYFLKISDGKKSSTRKFVKM